MNQVRFGVVGYGNIGRTHVATLSGDRVPRADVAAIVARAGTEVPAGIPLYTTLEDLLDADAVDAVVVATPTLQHASAAEQILAAGKHLLMEKPLANSVGDAQRMVALVPGGTKAAVMLNQRYHRFYRRMHEMVHAGALGPIVRFAWTMTAWYRPDVYFQVSPWRGTWTGEGGGALVNQCIHNLDVLQWILGMPRSVVAQAQFGKFHAIDVEDEITAMFAGPEGVSGMLVASTGEAPGMNLFEIVGDLGTLRFDGERLQWWRAGQSVAEHCAHTDEMFGMPEFTTQDVQVALEEDQHAAVFNDFVAAVLDDAPLATPLASGVNSLALANAMLLSAWTDQRIDLPVDAAVYQRELDRRAAEDGLRTPQQRTVHIDMDSSYR